MKKDRRAARDKAKRRERECCIRSILEQLGIWNTVRGELRAKVLKTPIHAIEFLSGDNIPPNETVNELIDELVKAANDATFNCPLLGSDYSVAIYLAHVLPVLKVLVRESQVSPSAALSQKIGQLAVLTDSVTMCGAVEQLCHGQLQPVLMVFSQADGYIYTTNPVTHFPDRGKWIVRFVVHRTEPEKRLVTKDGKPRTAFRCGIPFYSYDDCQIEWIEWTADLLGENGDATYPVFVQRHAIERVYQRLLNAFSGLNVKGFLQHILVSSMRRAVIHRRVDGTLLVEFKIRQWKLGYLVVRKIEGIILVESFLFLTMDGTPEGELLWKRLRLARADKELQGLDEFKTFVFSDVATDPKLVKIFTDCGCGHLFNFRNENGIESVMEGYAEGIRKYLNMKPVRSNQL